MLHIIPIVNRRHARLSSEIPAKVGIILEVHFFRNFLHCQVRIGEVGLYFRNGFLVYQFLGRRLQDFLAELVKIRSGDAEPVCVKLYVTCFLAMFGQQLEEVRHQFPLAVDIPVQRQQCHLGNPAVQGQKVGMEVRLQHGIAIVRFRGVFIHCMCSHQPFSNVHSAGVA